MAGKTRKFIDGKWQYVESGVKQPLQFPWIAKVKERFPSKGGDDTTFEDVKQKETVADEIKKLRKLTGVVPKTEKQIKAEKQRSDILKNVAAWKKKKELEKTKESGKTMEIKDSGISDALKKKIATFTPEQKAKLKKKKELQDMLGKK
jgi:hypothetical protein